MCKRSLPNGLGGLDTFTRVEWETSHYTGGSMQRYDIEGTESTEEEDTDGDENDENCCGTSTEGG
jgi:hypothetical protein